MKRIGGTGEFTINGLGPFRGRFATEVETQTIYSASATKPDPSWSYVDPAGHFHAWSFAGDRPKTPTLWRYTEHVDCDGSCGEGACEGYDVEHYRCLICDAPVEPMRILDQGPAVIVTGEGWRATLDGWPGEVDAVTEAVSVRILSGDLELFGVARVSDWQMGPDGTQVSISGCSQLGKRNRR